MKPSRHQHHPLLWWLWLALLPNSLQSAELTTSFTNSILPGFHADPSICRMGEDYFLVNSSFEYFPGVPVFQSKDLVNWKPIGHVLTHRHRPDDPLQALSHGDLVETPDGWWVVFLGFRPQGGKYHHLGRETLLAPVTWQNGWPVVNDGQPIPATLPAPKLERHPWPGEAARDEFNSPALRAGWNFVRNPHEPDYSLTARPGWLRLRGSAVTLNEVDSPTLVGRRQTSLNCQASTQLSFQPPTPQDEAGLVLRGKDNNHCEIGVTLRDGQRQVFFREVWDGQVVEPRLFARLPDGEVRLSVKAQPLSYEFFYQAAGGQPTSLGTARTRDLVTETLTAQKNADFNFTGVFIGLFATGNGQRTTAPADFDWFEYQSPDK